MDAEVQAAQAVTAGTAEQLQSILALCKKMSTKKEVPELLALLAKEGARLLEAERVTIFLLDEEHRELWSQVTLDGERIRFDARLGIAGAAAMTGEVINVSDAQQDQRFYQAVDTQTNFRTRTVLAVPLRTPAGQIIGAFQALNRKGGSFQGQDEHVAQALADQVAIAIETASTVQALRAQQQQLESQNAQLWREVEGRYATECIIGTSPRVQNIVRLIDQLRDSAVDVLITGESGTGKELVAKALHYNSPRARKPFVAINCAALPENLVESELFGIEKGVATGVEKRIGKFEEANHGTLFLDEIGELPQATQAVLLRVLAEREVTRVGGRSAIPIDVRVVAATNVDLEKAIKKGSFRSDLYYRLNVVPIQTPPLREIREDLPVLSDFLLQKIGRESGAEAKTLSAAAKRCLSRYDWPGNVRELENELRRLAVSVRRVAISEQDLAEHIRHALPGGAGAPGETSGAMKDAVEELEMRMMSEALRRCRGNQLQAAKALGLSRQGLIKKMKRYRLKPT